jgi:wyosine [tRNA(Phe)-imidazoG37] synthetase (radical SAM superfamily)
MGLLVFGRGSPPCEWPMRVDTEPSKPLNVRMTPPYRFLFGPVPSRRLGRSLGIDLVPFKTCSLDCVFCEVGRTTCLTAERREYVPTGEVLREIEAWLHAGGQADFITLAGSGEPTLHTGFGEVLRGVRTLGGPPTALLSNGTLFDDAEVRREALGADIVKLSLSAWDRPSFDRLHRPDASLCFDAILHGYRLFREMFPGELWIEVFLVPGVNADPDDVRRIAATVAPLRPERIHLNTAVRPPADDWVTALPPDKAEQLAALFTPTAEPNPGFRKPAPRDTRIEPAHVLALLRRRACTAEQIADGLAVDIERVQELLTDLRRENRVQPLDRAGGIFYAARPDAGA